MDNNKNEEEERGITKDNSKIIKAIDYRRYYIDYLSNLIEENLKKLREINDMPENLVNEKIIEDRREWMVIEEQNRELSNKKLEELKNE